jgi:hypothetical protein
MNTLHKSINNNDNLAPEEGQRVLLCNSKMSFRCPSLDINNSSNMSEDVALDYLASILVEAFLDKKEYERQQLHKSKASDNLL